LEPVTSIRPLRGGKRGKGICDGGGKRKQGSDEKVDDVPGVQSILRRREGMINQWTRDQKPGLVNWKIGKGKREKTEQKGPKKGQKCLLSTNNL